MALIADHEVVTFINEKLRPAADRLAQAYYFAKTVLDERSFDSLATKIPLGSTDRV